MAEKFNSSKVSFVGQELHYDKKSMHIKRWNSDPQRWSTMQGQEISIYKGKSIEEILREMNVVK
jgi:hypothetical protein